LTCQLHLWHQLQQPLQLRHEKQALIQLRLLRYDGQKHSLHHRRDPITRARHRLSNFAPSPAK
jgi:hypothetical protein